jgi:methylated-DNA-[protein]-cysteine S-methyltransferase
MAQKLEKTVRYVIFSTEWGYFGLAGTKKGLLRSHLPCPKPEIVEKHLLWHGLEARENTATDGRATKAYYDEFYFHSLQQQIIAYFEGHDVNLPCRIPLLLGELSPFCRAVLNTCRDIPFGRTLTYAELAKKLRKPKAARAIGNALALNPLPLIIPCHRVIRSDGEIGGFTAYGGAQLKQRLLKLEGESG